MTTTQQPEIREGSLSRDLLNAARYYLGGRRGFLVFAAIVLGAGLWLGWPALVAAGIAPILIALAPCAVMCALGLCMHRMGSGTAANPAVEGNARESALLSGTSVRDAAPLGSGCAHCESTPEPIAGPPAAPHSSQPQQEKAQ